MAISEAVIIPAITNLLAANTQYAVERICAGKLRAQGRRNEVYLTIHKGFPPEGESAQNYLREFIESYKYAFDIWMKPFGIWHKKISSKGIILTVDLWIRGPLCAHCYNNKFGIYKKGIIFKRKVHCCSNCGTRLPKIDDFSKYAMKLGKNVKKLVVNCLRA